MTRDDITRMAREAGLCSWVKPPRDFVAKLERFTALVIEAEREACANVCDEIEKKKWLTVTHGGEMHGISARDCAAAIRARGEK
jgi:hypothetical protein